MEPIGLAVGFTGLVGLFTACVDSFKLVQIYRRRKDDFDICQTMLDNQQFHFMAWGQACGFMGDEADSSSDQQHRLKEKFNNTSQVRNAQIVQTLNAVCSLLTDANQLKAKYGLKKETPVSSALLERSIQDVSSSGQTQTPSAFRRAFRGTSRFWNTSLQRTSYIKGAILWTINDKDRFQDLIDNLRNLITDLANLTEAYGIAQSQFWIIKYEMSSIEDEASLEAITQVNSSAPDDDLVSVAASRQLAFVRERSVAGSQANGRDWGPIQPYDSVSIFNKPTTIPTLPLTQGLEETFTGPQPLEITRVLPSQWRNVKTRQGLFPWLGVLVVCSNTATSRTTAAEKDSGQSDPLAYITRALKTGENTAPTSTQSMISPSRVAINSKTLIAVLEKITGIRIPEANNVMVHPFKLIMKHAFNIRKVYKSVCDECNAKESTITAATDIIQHGSSSVVSDTENYTDTVVDSPSDDDLLRNVERVRAEMECLIEFMDTDLALLFDVVKRRQTAKVNNFLPFSHLCVHFKVTSLVITKAVRGIRDWDTAQGYVILNISGGRPILDDDENGDTATSSNSRSQVVKQGDICDDEDFNSASFLMTPLVLDCSYLDSDGRTIGPRPKRIIIPPYTGLRSTQSLPVGYPRQQDRDRLSARGQVFVDAITPRGGEQVGGHLLFSGISNAELEPGHKETCRYCAQATSREQVDGAVIVDHAAAIQHQRGTSCNFEMQFGQGVVARPTKNDPRECFDPLSSRDSSTGRRYTDVFDDSVVNLQQSPFKKQWVRWRRSLAKIADQPFSEGVSIAVLPHRVLAFSLASRKWYPLPVSKLSAIPANPRSTVWDDLILPEGHKDLVLALVSVLGGRAKSAIQQLVSDSYSEITLGKKYSQRRCLTGLMHGAPGTGKTHLVQGVANHLGRPLFTISCAEIGTVERGATAKLGNWFNLASRWGCVLLLKEVDAFLAQRRLDDEVDRVEITAVLLRLLQSFSGVAFLSTNRIGRFDESFLSHLNFSLYFPPLDRVQKMGVWELFRRGAKDDFIVDRDSLTKYSSELFRARHMNGREIRNMWQTAMSLALFEHQRSEDTSEAATGSVKPRLEVQHFETVERSAVKFRNYLTVMTDSTGGDRLATSAVLTDIDADGVPQLAIHSRGGRDTGSPVMATDPRLDEYEDF